MKQVTIRMLSLRNFKGIKSIDVTFNGKTRIYGDNATGKTTLVDAFMWLLFGKDSTGRKEFSIKTYDSSNNVIHKLDHEVTGIFSVDGETIELKRIFREKWVTRRGSNEPELQGHETLFFWNDVPMKANEYQAKVDEIIAEETFKIISSPLYFNSLKWQDRREILTAISGDVTDESIAETRLEFKALFSALGKKSLDEMKKEISAKKKRLKDELNLIPGRVDEVTRSIPEAKDWKFIEDEIETLNKNLGIIDEQLQDTSKAHAQFNIKKQKAQQRTHELKTKISDIEFEARKKFNNQMKEKQEVIDNAKSEIDKINRKVQDDIAEIERLQATIKGYEQKQSELRDKWIKTNAEEFPGYGDQTQFVCPTCKQTLPAGDVETKKAEIRQNWDRRKAENLQEISNEGKGYNPQIERAKKRIAELESLDYESQVKKHEQTLSEWENKHLTSVQSILSGDKVYNDAKAELEQLESQPQETFTTEVEETNLRLKKTSIQQSVDALKKDLGLKEIIEKGEVRKNELLRQEKTYAKELAELEQTEFTIEELTRAKVDALESKINAMFDGVKFRMFDTQLNGGLIECCDTIIDGVPWTDANNAARINAGIAIINVLTKHYGQTAPIWIDNSESVTKIHSTDSQLVELYVSESHKQLEIEIA